MSASRKDPVPRAGPIRRVANRDIVLRVISGGLRNALAKPRRIRERLVKNLWIEVKCFSATGVRNIEVSQIRGIERINVSGPVSRLCPLVLSALSTVLDCKTIFEFGTYRGQTTWLLAHNSPSARIHTLDLPGPEAVSYAKLELTDHEYFKTWDRGARFHGTSEASRITQLSGDSATFDFTPFRGAMDLVYVDASHSYSYVRSDTEAALEMLSELGTIVWDDYTFYPGIYAYVNDLARSLDRPVFHILGTRLAFYSRRDVVAED